MGQIGVGTAEIEVKFQSCHGSPLLAKGTDLMLERPCVARLLKQLPIRLSDRVGPHEPVGIEIRQCFLSLALCNPTAYKGGVDSRIDDQVGDVNILGPE